MTSTLEKLGPAHRHREGDSMWYLPPLTGERFLSVTSVLDFAQKPALANYWKPNQAAKAAFDDLGRLVRATLTKTCGRTNSRCYYEPNGHDKRIRCKDCPCGDCQPCITLELQNAHFRESKRATDRGKAMHDVIEWWTLHGNLPSMADDIEPYAKSFLQFVTDAGLTPDSWEMAEATVLNRTDRWGGTLDGRVRFDATATPLALKVCKKFGLARPLLSFDAKSREAEDAAFFAEMALQLTAYRRGEVVLLDDGTEIPLGSDDGGLVVQIHQSGYHWRAVRTRDEEYEAFLGLLRFAYWSIEHGTAATQVKSFPDLEIPGLPAPVKRAAAKRTPAKKAAPKKQIVQQVVEEVQLPGVNPDADVDWAKEIKAATDLVTLVPLMERMNAAGVRDNALHRLWWKRNSEIKSGGGATPTKSLQAVTAGQSATLRSMTRRLSDMDPHPDSPMGDAIPF